MAFIPPMIAAAASAASAAAGVAATVAPYVAAAGTMLEGVSAYQQGKYQSNAYQAQAQQASIDAGSESTQALEKGARTLGEGITVAAKQGGFTGSALDVLQDVSRQSMYEARRASAEGVAENRGLMAQARAASQRGTMALVTSTIKAGATIMGAGMLQREAAAQRLANAPRVAAAPGVDPIEGLY